MLKANFQRVKRDVDRILPENFCKELPSKTDIYLVGGILRDSFFPELSPREIDLLIIGMEIDELLSVLRKFGKANLVGKSFGVIKWRPRKNSPDIDVSIPAIRNINLKEGIALNPYMSIEDDLAQRDFTANAIALNLQTDEVLDPLGGIEDIEKGFLKTISSESLKNDPHRIVRASYICARCNLKITTETLDLMSKSLPELKHITSERIAEELKKIMLYLEKPSKALRLWRDWEILDYILPELSESVGVTQEGGWHAYDVFEHSLAAVDAAPAKLDVRLAALFHDSGKPAKKQYIEERDRATFYGHQYISEKKAKAALTRLRFSKKIIDRVTRLVRHHMFAHAETDKGIRRFIRRVGEDLLDDLFELRYSDIIAQGTDRDDTSDKIYQKKVMHIIDSKPPLCERDLAIDGNDIITLLHIPQGREVGRVLKYLLEQVLDNPNLNNREQLIELAIQFYNQNFL